MTKLRKPTRQRSLMSLLSAAVIVTVALVFSIQATYYYYAQRQRIVESMHREAAESILRLQRNIAPLMEAYAINEYDKLVDSETRLKHHYAIVVRDLRMGEILGQAAYISGRIHSRDGHFEEYDPTNPQQRRSIEHAYFSDSGDILSGDGQRLGRVSVYYTDQALRRELKQVVLGALPATLFTAVLLVGLLVFLVQRLLFRPLKHIARVMEQQDADGIPTQHAPDFAYRELSTLSNTMNAMLQEVRRSRDSLQIERTRLSNVIEGTRVGTWEWNVQTGEVFFNERWANIIGYTLAELQPLSIATWERFTHKDDLQRSNQLLQEHFAKQLDYYECEVRMRHKDGHWVWVLDRGKVSSRTEDGQPLLMSGTHQDITEQKLSAMRLSESEAHFRSFFEKNSSVMLLVDPTSGSIADANQAAERFYGYPEGQLVGMSTDLINSLPPEQVGDRQQRALAEKSNHFKFRHRLANGEIRDVEIYATPVHVSERPTLFVIVHDITDRTRAEEQLRLAASVFTHAREGIIITDARANIIDVNDAFTQITGYGRDEVLGKHPRLLSSGRQTRAFYAGMRRELLEKDHWFGELWERRKNGELFAELLTISTVRNAEGSPKHFVALFSDITELKKNERELEHIAHYDPLTGLPNRLVLGDRLRQAMAQERRRGQQVAVAFLDLDGFKVMNDRYGHEAGDQLLIGLANHMRSVLREGDTLARLGGDEFVAVLPDLASRDDCTPILQRLLGAASAAEMIDGETLQVTASLGVTFFPQDEEVDADQLLRQADQAMYQAKLSGKNRFHLFDAELDRNLRGRREKLERITQALEDAEFELHYQPKVNMRSGLVIGAEALIRWQHPEHGLLPPNDFLPVIEDHPLMVQLGEWTLDRALAQIAAWQNTGLRLPVSVNIAARHLQQHGFVQRLRAILANHPDVSPTLLELEVLETSALDNMAHVFRVIKECQEFGVSFALDDFGTGYSSLTYLKRLPAETLKIDRSFVRDMHDDPEDLAILEGIIGLASAFRRQVIAEGVETSEHGNLLLWLGCELAQGFGIARPMPAEQLPHWQASWQPPASWQDHSTISRQHLPAVFSMVEHRAWLNAMDGFLREQRSSVPPMDAQQCRFGLWLNSNKEGKHAELVRTLVPLHEKLHALAAELLAQKQAGKTDQALLRIDQLHRLGDTMQHHLRRFVE